MINGTAIVCDCCDCQRMAFLDTDGLRLRDRRHGTTHQAQLSPEQILVRLAGTTGGSAVVDYVRAIFK